MGHLLVLLDSNLVVLDSDLLSFGAIYPYILLVLTSLLLIFLRREGIVFSMQIERARKLLFQQIILVDNILWQIGNSAIDDLTNLQYSSFCHWS